MAYIIIIFLQVFPSGMFTDSNSFSVIYINMKDGSINSVLLFLGNLKQKLTEKHKITHETCVRAGNEPLSSISLLEEPFFLHILGSQMTHCESWLNKLLVIMRLLIGGK